MPNHSLPDHAAKPIDFDARRAEIASLHAAHLRARISGDDAAARRLERLCKYIGNLTFAEGIGRSQFSDANIAVVTGMREGRAALCEAEMEILRAIEAADFGFADGKPMLRWDDGAGDGRTATVIRFPVRPRR